METCVSCGQEIPEPLRVSIHGMYDCHLFMQFTDTSVDSVIANWLRQWAEPHEELGPPALCPAIVLRGNTELRRVGPMVHRDSDLDGLAKYREALLADPDIPRLLSERDSTRQPAETQ